MGELAYSTKAGEALLAMFQEYRAWNRRSTPELVKKQTVELANYLFLCTPRASASEIQAKLDSLGARFMRAPRAYARKVGKNAPSSWQSEADKAVIKGRRKDINKQARDTFGRFDRMEVVKLTLSEERYAAYNFRIGHIGAMAASWIPAMRALGSKLRVAQEQERKAARRPLSRVIAQLADEKSSIAIVNQQEGMEELADRTGFVDKAFDMTSANMQVYINRKKAEASQIFSKAESAARMAA